MAAAASLAVTTVLTSLSVIKMALMTAKAMAKVTVANNNSNRNSSSGGNDDIGGGGDSDGGKKIK